MVWIDVLCLCLSLYLDVVDSHLLLSWAGSGCCDTALRRESRAAVLPSPLVLLGNDPLFADRLETALRVRQSMVLGETWQFTMPASPATS